MDGFISISADTRISFSPWCPRVLSLVLDRFYVGISTETTFPLLISSVVGDVNTAITTPRSIYIRHRPSLVYGCIDGASSAAALCDCGDGTLGHLTPHRWHSGRRRVCCSRGLQSASLAPTLGVQSHTTMERYRPRRRHI